MLCVVPVKYCFVISFRRLASSSVVFRCWKIMLFFAVLFSKKSTKYRKECLLFVLYTILMVISRGCKRVYSFFLVAWVFKIK